MLPAKSNNNPGSFVYYGKTIPIPNIDDIILVDVGMFNIYYILVKSVVLNPGKHGYKYSGIILKQRDMEVGMAPYQLTSRDKFELTDKKITIYPKDRSKVNLIKILEF
jgi:hypothetical protein